MYKPENSLLPGLFSRRVLPRNLSCDKAFSDIAGF
jgi:hypothetical protein